jgi:hypothetical protein
LTGDRLIDGHVFTRIALIHQRGRAYFVRATLIADDADQIGAAELQIVFLAESVELLQVNTRHDSPLVAAAVKQLRVNWPSPIGVLQPIDAPAVFDAVDFRRRGQTLTDPLLGQLEQAVVNDGAHATGIAGLCNTNHG